MQVIKETKTICPECLKVLDATIFEEDNKVYIEKECQEHGKFREIYWSDYEQYQRAETLRCDGDGLRNPRTETKLGCPYDCGICPEHKSHTGLAIIDVTNRCNLKCPVCFANAAAAGYVYEPSKEEIIGMLENLRRNDPVPPPALQFSGGEPTIRKDLFDLVKKAKELGFHHMELNTNGLRLAKSLDFCRGLLEAGVSTVYLQFDGLTSDVYEFTRGVDLLDIKMKALENCREAGLSIVLVVTLVKGVNDHQLGDIIRFAIKNFDLIRCVNVQPVSICGRIPEEERKKMRITIPDFMRLVEEQTDGKIKVSDFYPVPTVVPISRAVGSLKDKDYVEFTAHPHCGMATYAFVEGDDLIPINRYGNVDKFIKSMEKVYEEAKKGNKRKAKLSLSLGALRHINFGLLRKYLLPILRTGSYESLGNLHRKMLLISSMHFMDPYNFDLERVQRCCIHYAVPDGRIIPFCTMNSIHRTKIEEKLGTPVKEWKKKHKIGIGEVA
ncbi:MAG: radical SAM protein [Candidatus Bathyarchaeota archaeon]|nr:radical SAM protein [Candidatus Bathyarchaeota archaeon]